MLDATRLSPITEKLAMEPAGRYQGVEKHSSGFKLLAAMGWKEGDGLVRTCKNKPVTAPQSTTSINGLGQALCRVRNGKG